MQGILIINKEKGFTSQDVVSKVKRILNIKKAGHTGTLDPMATGVLPVLLGNYTKLSKYLIEHDKKYEVKLKFGEKRDTGDSEGKIIETKEVSMDIFKDDKIKEILNSFLGETMQIPPMYSAIKVNGKKLYEYARKGLDIEVEARQITIYEINLIDVNKENLEIKFSVKCSKGTYIRSLCEGIAEKLGTIGYMSALKRTLVDRFSIDNAITLEKLKKNKDNVEFLEKHLIKMEQVFGDFPTIILNNRKTELFLNGVMLTFELDDGLYNIYDNNNSYIGTGIIKESLLKRDVVIIGNK